MRDLNAQVYDVQISGVVGDFGVMGVDEYGDLLLEICVYTNEAVCITYVK